MAKKKKKNKNYFTQETEDAIVRYNECDDPDKRNTIYNEYIKYPFEKLAENAYHTFNYPYVQGSPEDVQAELVSLLIEKIGMYKQDSGKAFSYFTVTARNYLMMDSMKNYKKLKRVKGIPDMPPSWDVENNFEEEEQGQEYHELKEVTLKFWENNLTSIFTKKRDIQIADAILELVRRANYIEDFNKKHLYILIREMTGVKTHYITKVINTMKSYQKKIMDDFFEYGDIQKTGKTSFWN